MGKIIPPKVKKQVITDWLNGLSRDNIALNNQISGGTVSAIIKEYRRNDIPDIDLLRALAVALRKKNLGLDQFASSMKLRNMLDYLELPEERIEKFLEDLCVFFYKNDEKSFEDFLLQVESVSEVVRVLDVSIYDILDEIDKRKTEIVELNKKISILNQLIIKKTNEFVRVAKNNENYRAARMFDHTPK